MDYYTNQSLTQRMRHMRMMGRLQLMEIHMSCYFQMKQSCHSTRMNFHMKMKEQLLLQEIHRSYCFQMSYHLTDCCKN